MRFAPGILSALFLLCRVAAGHASLVGGALEGTVSDSSGGRIAGAPVQVRDIATERLRRVMTGAEGRFRITELPAGAYEVLVSHPGFTAYRHTGVTVALGATVRLEIALQSAAVTTEVTVSAQPSPIDPAQTSMSSGVDTERIEELPVESRNYLNFVLLAPGVAGSGQHSGRQSSGAAPDSGFSFGGLRGRSNNVTIDGLDNNDEFTGSSRTELSLETVQEFQVVNAGLSAETGGASGGSINVITRNGANAIHGDAFVFVENAALGARNPFETERAAPDLERYRAGFALGGPVVTNRTFYYSAIEQEHSRSLEESFIDRGTAAAIDGVLASGAFPRLNTRSINEGRFPAARAETEASIKLNHQLSDRNWFMLRYAFTNNREAGDAFHAGGLFDASARGSSFTRDNDVAAALTTIFGPQAAGDLRVQYANRRAVSRTNDAAGPGIDIAGLVSFGRPYEGNGARTEVHNQISWTYSRAAGRHLFKTGATFNRVSADASIADGFGGLYLFSALADFAAGRPEQFRQSFGSARTQFAVANSGGFVQDHWSITRKLTVDVGVRYDFEHLPSGLRQDINNVSPRIGLAYQAASGWVVRAGYGIFFDRYILVSLDPVFQKNGRLGFEQVVDGAAAAALLRSAQGGAPAAPLPGVAASIYRADPGLATPYSQQANAAVQHQIGRDLTATASYLFVRGVKLARTRNVNLLPPGPQFGPGRANANFNDVYELEHAASSRYRGLSLALNRRMSDELAFSASYTLARTWDDASDFNEQPANPFHLRPEWALSRQDQRHRLVFNALWELPIGDEADAGRPPQRNWVSRVFGHVELAPIVTVESGRPANPLTGIDTNLTHAYPLAARPLGFGRNSLRTSPLANTDLRVLKFFPFGKTARLDLVAEAFNLFNHTNALRINPVFGTGTVPQAGFMQPLAGAGARRIQFSVDYEF